MSSTAVYEQLDAAIESMLRHRSNGHAVLDLTVGELLIAAGELRTMPSPAFRERLRLDLEAEATRLYGAAREAKHGLVAISSRTAKNAEEEILPTLFGAGYGTYAVHKSNFVVSGLLHAAALAFVLASSLWIMRHPTDIQRDVISLISEPSEYSLPVATQKAGGGGGGGDRDRLAASKGTAPPFSKEQITPPAIVVRNETPKLPATPTVVGPPEIKLPQSPTLGDPLAALLAPPSNGTGSSGGIGSGSGGGLGSGTGPGVGPGYGGGIGGGVYRVGGGVSAPRVLYDPDPEYSEEARKAKHQGTVVLWIVVRPDGRAHEIRVSRALGMGLDEKAVEAVRKWRFEPALKDGQPVPVQVNVEVNFRLY